MQRKPSDINLGLRKDKFLCNGVNTLVRMVSFSETQDEELNKLLTEKKFIYKEVRNAGLNKQEPILTARYGNLNQGKWKKYAFQNKQHDYSTGWVSEFIEGRKFLSQDTSNLSFADLMQLIFKLVVRTNLFHHNTIKGNAVVHGDIKGHNLIFNPEKLEIEYIDYGCSFELADNDDADTIKNHPELPERTPLRSAYFAPEAHESHLFGIKTDIYMLAQCIKFHIASRLPKTTPDIAVFVHGYLARAMSRNYVDRPDSDEFLKFFTLLNNFYKTPATDVYLKTRAAAKIAMLYAKKGNEKISDEIDANTWEQYYLHDVGNVFSDYDNSINQVVCCLARYKCDVNWSEITAKPDFVRAVAGLYENSNFRLSKELLEFLFNHNDICVEFNESDKSQQSVVGLFSILYNKVHQPEIKNILTAWVKSWINTERTLQGVDAVVKLVTDLPDFLVDEVQEIEQVANKQKIKLAQQSIKVEDFKKKYNTQYDSEFFTNPWSKMREHIDDSDLTMDKVLKHARKNENSRTARVLKAMVAEIIGRHENEKIGLVEKRNPVIVEKKTTFTV